MSFTGGNISFTCCLPLSLLSFLLNPQSLRDWVQGVTFYGDSSGHHQSSLINHGQSPGNEPLCFCTKVCAKIPIERIRIRGDSRVWINETVQAAH